MGRLSAGGSESPSPQRLRCTCLWLLVFEGFLAIFSATTLTTGGYLGLAAAVLVFIGAAIALCRGCGNTRRGFTLMLALVAAAILLTLVQMVMTLLILVNGSERKDLDLESRRAMCAVLLLAYACGLSVRVVVAISMARIWKGAATSRRVGPASTRVLVPRLPIVAVGVPVALAVGTVATPGRFVPEHSRVHMQDDDDAVTPPRSPTSSMVASVAQGMVASSPPFTATGGRPVPVPDGALVVVDVVPGSPAALVVADVLE